jgi:hypothetical protein
VRVLPSPLLGRDPTPGSTALPKPLPTAPALLKGFALNCVHLYSNGSMDRSLGLEPDLSPLSCAPLPRPSSEKGLTTLLESGPPQQGTPASGERSVRL